MPVTLMLPVLVLVNVPLKETLLLLVAKVSVPSFVTGPFRLLPTEVFASVTPLPVKSSVAPADAAR